MILLSYFSYSSTFTIFRAESNRRLISSFRERFVAADNSSNCAIISSFMRTETIL